MKKLLEKLKEKYKKIETYKNKIFVKIEKKIYHTKILLDFHAFETKKNQKHRFFIQFRKLFDREKTEAYTTYNLNLRKEAYFVIL